MRLSTALWPLATDEGADDDEEDEEDCVAERSASASSSSSSSARARYVCRGPRRAVFFAPDGPRPCARKMAPKAESQRTREVTMSRRGMDASGSIPSRDDGDGDDGDSDDE